LSYDGLNRRAQQEITGELEKLQKLCKELSLPVSAALISDQMDDVPQTVREYDILVKAVDVELKKTVGD